MEIMHQIPILLVGMSVQIFGWRPFTVQFLNERYENYDPKKVHFNLTITNGSYVDFELAILSEISQLFIDYERLHDSGNGKYDMVFMNRTVNVCMFLTNRKLNPFFAIGYHMLANHMEMPKGCPLRKKRYEMVNVFLDPEKFPPFMVDHKARVLANVWNRENGRHGKKKNLVKLSVEILIERSFKRTAVH